MEMSSGVKKKYSPPLSLKRHLPHKRRGRQIMLKAMAAGHCPFAFPFSPRGRCHNVTDGGKPMVVPPLFFAFPFSPRGRCPSGRMEKKKGAHH